MLPALGGNGFEVDTHGRLVEVEGRQFPVHYELGEGAFIAALDW